MSLYLKYRPQDFDSIVWQDFIKNTLKTALSSNRIVWAYLLCWPRWTWKTSTARILAKSINCLNQMDWNPCLKCEICIDFLDEKLIDIIEIDAASNTWVDNIRDLIQKALFKPTKTKYKVYIIDEVHMLSKWAFNALLKTLEEPPSHVKFILATTETHKVPETIISRCQRYDFKKISDIDIKNRLNYIAKNESIIIDNDSMDYIIKNSWWGLRNAISLFEQYINNWKIEFSDIEKNIWLVSYWVLNNFLNLLLSWNIEILNEFDNLIDSWINLKLFFRELMFLIKSDWIEKIKTGENISKIIYLLETFDEIIIKSKSSIDENTTYLIWLLKILNYFNNDIFSENELKIKTSTQNNKPEINIKNEKIKVDNKIVEKISQNDIEDIFTNNEIKNSNINEIEENINWNFNTDEFIKILKNIWAKWWLTMWIRWAKLSLNWVNLEIKFNTKFALKTIDTSENISLLNQAFLKLWYDWWEVILM